jgi:3-phenylpropionate/trans-cinnamate dioxygenase ferredoxin reductase subunit
MGLHRLIGEDGHVTAAELADGSVIPVDVLIVGIGVTANDALAHDAGVETSNGILVDSHGRTSDPAVFAMGDCAVFPWHDMRVRLESVQNAVDQAEAIAAILTGGSEPYDPNPWFWSDQYDVKLQIAGFGLGHDETLVRPGQREGSVSVWYFRQGKFIAVDAINDAKAYVTGKKLLEAAKTPDRKLLADPQIDLKALLA